MTIGFNELAGINLVPTVAVETDWTTGLHNMPDKTKKLLIVAMMETGTATAAKVYRVDSVTKSDTLFGRGSHVSNMVAVALRITKGRVPIFCMGYAESGGSAAAGTVTLATTATSSGTLVVMVGGRRHVTPVVKTDTTTAVGDDLAALINADPDAPFTAANNAGVVTITARTKGPEGNSIQLRCSLGSCGMTATASGAKFTAGTTAGTISLVNAEGERFHVIAVDATDTTNLGVLKLDREAQAGALVQKGGIAIMASTTDASTATTLAGTQKSYRCQVVCQMDAEAPVWEVAAAFAAERARVVDPAEGLDNNVLDGLLPTYDRANWPTTAELETMLAGGVTPLVNGDDGKVRVVRSVITKPSSDTTVTAYIDHNPSEISDYCDADLINQVKLRLHGKKLKSLSAAGTPKTITPTMLASLVKERMRIWDRLDYVEGAELDIKAGRVVAEVNNDDRSRADAGFPFRPVGIAHNICVLKTYTKDAIASMLQVQ